MNRAGHAAILITLAMFAKNSVAYAAQDEVYFCGEKHRLTRHMNSDGSHHAYFAVRVSGVWATCFFVFGHQVALKQLSMWSEKEIGEKQVWTYLGFPDHCSQAKMLLFNEHTLRLTVLNVSDFKGENYSCKSS